MASQICRRECNGRVQGCYSTMCDSQAVAMQVVTYDVVPLSPALGLLQFVAGTQPLLDAMLPGFPVGALDAAQNAFLGWIQASSALHC